MQRHLMRAVAKGFENGYLIALRADQPLEHHIEQKSRHAQKNGGEHARHGAQGAHFFVQEAVGRLVHAPDGALAAVARQRAVERINHLALVGLRSQLGRDLVERAIHIHGGGQRPLRHPHNGKALVIRKAGVGIDLVQIFGRRGNARNREQLRAPVHGDAQLPARRQLVRLGKGIADQNAADGIGRRHLARAQVNAVLQGLAAGRQRQHQRRYRLVKTRHIHLAAGDYARFYLADAGNFAQPRSGALRRAFEGEPHVREAVVAVQLRRRAVQRIQRGLRHHQHGNARRNDQRNRQRLPAHQPQVAQRLAVQGFHGRPFAFCKGPLRLLWLWLLLSRISMAASPLQLSRRHALLVDRFAHDLAVLHP